MFRPLVRLAVLLFLPSLITAETIKVVALYGKYTGLNDHYKQLLTDASTYINDAAGRGILPSGDQVNVIHEKVLEDRVYEEQTLSKSLYSVCNDFRSTEPLAVILPNDLCEECEDLGTIIGDAYSPVITLDQADGSGAFKMRPNLNDMGEMLTDVIDHFKWRDFIFLYEGDIGTYSSEQGVFDLLSDTTFGFMFPRRALKLVALYDLYITAFTMVESMASKATKYGWNMVPVKIEDDFTTQTADLLGRRVKNILCYVTNEDILVDLVDTAFESKLLSNGWHWIFGNLNPPITKQFLEQKYRHNMAFLTRFKVVSNELLYYTSISKPIREWQFRERAAYDALVAIATAMKLHDQREGQLPRPVPICGSDQRSTLEQYLREVNFRGASGDVAFDRNGNRVNYTINMYSGKDHYAENLAGFFVQDIKSWELATRNTWPGQPGKRMYIEPFRQSDVRFIKVLAVPEPPFFMEKGWEDIRYPQNRRYKRQVQDYDEEDEPYEGIAWEILKEVKKVMEEEMGVDFNFQITLMSRGQYGTLDLSTGEWDGMVRELIDGDADVAIGALARNEAREEDIDFTVPWFRSEIKLLILHPSWSFEYPFSIVYPMHITAWFALLAIFVIICGVVMLLGRFSPYEWRSLSERGEASKEEGDTFSFFDSIFYVLSTAFLQSYTRGPRSWSLRVVSAFWFWFSLCIVFIYAFNLDSVFKFSKTAIEIRDSHDLLFQDILKFGAVRYSPSYDFYRYNTGQYRQVFDRMLNAEENLLEDRIEDAVFRIRRQWDARYGIVGEENILKYAGDRKPCRLFVTGRTLGRIIFPMATPSGSPLRDQLSFAINLLRERGVIDRISKMEFSDRLQCSQDSVWEEQTRRSFTLHDLQGLYYLLFIGMGCSGIVFVLEWLVSVLFFGHSWQGRSPRGTGIRNTAALQRRNYDDREGEDKTGGANTRDWL